MHQHYFATALYEFESERAATAALPILTHLGLDALGEADTPRQEVVGSKEFSTTARSIDDLRAAARHQFPTITGTVAITPLNVTRYRDRHVFDLAAIDT